MGEIVMRARLLKTGIDVVVPLEGPSSEAALALLIGERWFVGFSKAGRIQTSWCVVGARLFFVWNQPGDLAKVEKRLHAKRRPFVRVLLAATAVVGAIEFTEH